MSWFNHVSQGSNPQQHQEQPQQQQQQQQPPPSDCHRLADILCGTPNPSPRGPAAQRWTGRPAPLPGEHRERLPPAPPQGVSSPPSLEELSCASPGAGQVVAGDPEPISYVSLQEQRCVLGWFQGWTPAQRERFMQDLLGKAVPGKVCTLLDSLSTLQVKDRLPNIFECQLRLWTQWFESWGEEERNHFLHILEERDPVFVAHFYRSVAGTAGRD